MLPGEAGSAGGRDTPGAPVLVLWAQQLLVLCIRQGESTNACLGMCALPLPGSGPLLTSPYPQGDAAPVGAPGEKGPNGLPVSMEQDCHLWGCQQLGVPADTFLGTGEGHSAILWAVSQGALVKPRGNAFFPPCRQARRVPDRVGAAPHNNSLALDFSDSLNPKLERDFLFHNPLICIPCGGR